MDNVNYTALNFHINGLELAKSKDINCRIMCGKKSAKRGDIVIIALYYLQTTPESDV